MWISISYVFFGILVRFCKAFGMVIPVVSVAGRVKKTWPCSLLCTLLGAERPAANYAPCCIGHRPPSRGPHATPLMRECASNTPFSYVFLPSSRVAIASLSICRDAEGFVVRWRHLLLRPYLTIGWLRRCGAIVVGVRKRECARLREGFLLTRGSHDCFLITCSRVDLVINGMHCSWAYDKEAYDRAGGHSRVELWCCYWKRLHSCDYCWPCKLLH